MVQLKDEGWQQLTIPGRKQCPKLFYHFSADVDGCELRLTDLMALWRCDLDRYDINAEAERQHASIDPSESTSQLVVLLSKMRQSLQNGDNLLTQDGKKSSQALLLTTTIDLPRPLKPLLWTFTLSSQNASEIAEQILRPCLHEMAVGHEKLQSLHRIIDEKDHVISKLLDRIGSSAVDLSLIFPGISGLAPRKGHITVEEAKRHVPGMAPFDRSKWDKTFADHEKDTLTAHAGLQNLVKGCEKCFAHSREEHENWINDLPPKGTAPIGKKGKKKTDSGSKASTQQSTPKQGGSSTDDEFERQATPPSLKSSRTKPDENNATSKSESPKQADRPSNNLRRSSDTSTATPSTVSEEEEDQSSDSQPLPSRTKKTSKLGGLKSNPKPKSVASRSPSPTNTSSPSHRLGRLRSTKPDSKSPEPTSQSTPSRRLGRLGGKKDQTTPKSADSKSQSKQAAKDQDSDATASPSPSPSPTPAAKEDGSSDSKPDSMSLDTPAKSASPPEPPQPEETVEQKANRRREELKRSLASNAGAKKRRRL